MNGITHTEALQWIDRRLDGLLTTRQLQLLDEHLFSCDSCRGHAAGMDLLPGRLQHEFHARWDHQPQPSQSIIEYVTSNARRSPMGSRFSAGIKVVASATALTALGLFINLVISQLQDFAPVGNVPRAEDRLLAFALEQNGDFDIYAMRPDGSELTNLTNDPSQEDLNPFWSPDGKYIAFERERHIFRMAADGSNVIQLTGGEATHRIGHKYGLDSSAWSPDGSQLIFLQSDPGASKWIPYTMDADGENEQPLVEQPDVYSFPAWSPDGQHIAFLRVDLVNSDGPHLYLVDPDGNNLREVTEFLPGSESLWSYEDYYWSRDGGSLFFIAWRHLDEGKDQWIAYEFSLADSQLIEKAVSSTPMGNWWEGTAFITGRADNREAPVTWLRSDGTYNILKPFEICKPAEEAQYGFTYQRSSRGDLVVAAKCPDGDWWLYWANPDGSVIKGLLNSPISAGDSDVLGFTWSPDAKFLAFSVTSNHLAEMYVLNVEVALSDPSVQPLKMTLDQTLLLSHPSWQPGVRPETVEEEPTPVATSQPSSSKNREYLAFVSETDKDYFDIFVTPPDGSAPLNLTHHPANDDHPFWSPDGTRLAFESDRSGTTQIYLMNADGSNLVQVTEGDREHRFLNRVDPWSPDGTRLLVRERTHPDSLIENDQWTLYSVGLDGQNKTALVQMPAPYLVNPSWAPDGEHIAFVVLDPPDNRNARIQVVDTNGNNLTEITKLMPDDEELIAWEYRWASDAQSILWVAGRSAWEAVGEDGRYAVYEATLNGETLLERATSSKPIGDWWQGTSFLLGFEEPFIWLRQDGTSSTLNPFEKCVGNERVQHSYTFKRSRRGNLLIGLSCPNGDLWLYWANPDGTVVRQLLDFPIPAHDSSAPDLSWSSNDRFITFNVDASPEITDLYILDVEAALNDPTTQPWKVTTDQGGSTYHPAWQPIP